jgi:hypothetical protein
LAGAENQAFERRIPFAKFAPMYSGKFFFTGIMAFVLAIFVSGCAEIDWHRPILSELNEFENAPDTGPGEAEMPVRAIPTNSVAVNWPGKGLAQHPFLYYGEGNNVLYVVNDGRVIWKYALPPGGEIDDAWVRANGNIVCTKMTMCYEITPQKKIVWAYRCPTNTQIHAIQPFGQSRVMVVQNGLPPHLYIINKADNSKFVSYELPVYTNTIKSIHTQFRNCRVTSQGTYLIPSLDQGVVNEYDQNWHTIWTYKTGKPWSAVRLKNGNTLIPGDNLAYVHEVNRQGQIVWGIESNSIPGIALHDVQTASRLANGDTLICNRGPKNTYPPQVIEVTPNKKVVWVLQDYEHLPSCTGIQLLDEPGLPGKPGDLQR